MPAVRRNRKDTVFCHLFGSEKYKANALELYNALAGTSYTDLADLELTTIGDAIFLGIKNDVSFLVGNEMVLMEHQSTHNPNMPLRGLHYFSRLYTKLAETRELDLYGTAMLHLPTPHYVVFYFGEADRPEREVMRLSDSFAAGPGDLEVTATVLNCNEGRNRSIMEACEALRGYSHLMSLERTLHKAQGFSAEEAARAAVDHCIEDGVLVDYLTEHRAEVEDMLFTVQDEERAMRVHWKAVEREAREKGEREGREKGEREGRREGRREEAIRSLEAVMESTGCDLDAAMDILQIPDENRPELAELVS